MSINGGELTKPALGPAALFSEPGAPSDYPGAQPLTSFIDPGSSSQQPLLSESHGRMRREEFRVQHCCATATTHVLFDEENTVHVTRRSCGCVMSRVAAPVEKIASVSWHRNPSRTGWCCGFFGLVLILVGLFAPTRNYDSSLSLVVFGGCLCACFLFCCCQMHLRAGGTDTEMFVIDGAKEHHYDLFNGRVEAARV